MKPLENLETRLTHAAVSDVEGSIEFLLNELGERAALIDEFILNHVPENNIELVEINSIIIGLIAELRKKYPRPEKVGKEQGIARFLIHLIHNNFLRTDETTSHNGG